jgi:hypothetical protein
MIDDRELQRMAAACREHLTPDQYTRVGLAVLRDGERFADLLSERSGEAMAPRDFAFFVYQAAERIHAGGAS